MKMLEASYGLDSAKNAPSLPVVETSWIGAGSAYHAYG